MTTKTKTIYIALLCYGSGSDSDPLGCFSKLIDVKRHIFNCEELEDWDIVNRGVGFDYSYYIFSQKEVYMGKEITHNRVVKIYEVELQ